jgi:hypothetical protein
MKITLWVTSFGILSGLFWEYCFGYGELQLWTSHSAFFKQTSSFVVVKIILGVQLLSFAHSRRETMAIREAEDVVNDFGRDPIGEGQEERVS